MPKGRQAIPIRGAKFLVGVDESVRQVSRAGCFHSHVIQWKQRADLGNTTVGYYDLAGADIEEL